MLTLVKELNKRSPFLWEVITDGSRFSILCEESVFEDEHTDSRLEDLDQNECEHWLREILRTI